MYGSTCPGTIRCYQPGWSAQQAPADRELGERGSLRPGQLLGQSGPVANLGQKPITRAHRTPRRDAPVRQMGDHASLPRCRGAIDKSISRVS